MYKHTYIFCAFIFFVVFEFFFVTCVAGQDFNDKVGLAVFSFVDYKECNVQGVFSDIFFILMWRGFLVFQILVYFFDS